MNVFVVGTSVIDLFFSANPNHYSVSDKKVTFQLGDKVPISVTKISLGGNGSNVAVSLKRLGLDSSFYTYLGDDMLADEITQVLTKEGVSLFPQREKGENTSLHLILNFEEDRIIFSDYKVKEYAFNYSDSKTVDYLYLTSIPKEWTRAYTQVLEFVASTNAKLLFSPGSRQLDEMGEVFLKTLKQTHILFVNKEEGEMILKKQGGNATSEKDILTSLKTLGPNVISLTDGGNGAYCVDHDNKMYYIASFSDSQPIIQKTGAGDSYASAFLAAHILGMPVTESMRWGSFNANAVMQHLGAQDGLLKKQEMIKALDAHSNFAAIEIQ